MSTNFRENVLDAINNVETVTMESEYNVALAVGETYVKSGYIMENYTGDSLDDFSIYQESKDDDDLIGNDSKHKDKMWFKALMFIPRLLQKLWRLIKNTWNGTIVTKARELAGKKRKGSDKAKDVIKNLFQTDNEWDAIKIMKTTTASAAVVASGVGLVCLWRSYRKGGLRETIQSMINKMSNFFKTLKNTTIDYAKIFSYNEKTQEFTTKFAFKKVLGIFKQFFEKFKAVKNFNPKTGRADELIRLYENIHKFLKEVSNEPIYGDQVQEIYTKISFAEFLAECDKSYNNPEYEGLLADLVNLHDQYHKSNSNSNENAITISPQQQGVITEVTNEAKNMVTAMQAYTLACNGEEMENVTVSPPSAKDKIFDMIKKIMKGIISIPKKIFKWIMSLFNKAEEVAEAIDDNPGTLALPGETESGESNSSSDGGSPSDDSSSSSDSSSDDNSGNASGSNSDDDSLPDNSNGKQLTDNSGGGTKTNDTDKSGETKSKPTNDNGGSGIPLGGPTLPDYLKAGQPIGGLGTVEQVAKSGISKKGESKIISVTNDEIKYMTANGKEATIKMNSGKGLVLPNLRGHVKGKKQGAEVYLRGKKGKWVLECFDDEGELITDNIYVEYYDETAEDTSTSYVSGSSWYDR